MRLYIGRVETKLTSLDYLFCSRSASPLWWPALAALGLTRLALYVAPNGRVSSTGEACRESEGGTV